jgi:hypothetical protein
VAQVPKSAEGGQRKRKAEGSDKLEHAESGVGAAESADAGPATANAEGGQRKRKAEGPDTTEGGGAAPLKAEAESGVPPPRAKKARKPRSAQGKARNAARTVKRRGSMLVSGAGCNANGAESEDEG